MFEKSFNTMGHAVNAALVAPIGDGNSKIIDIGGTIAVTCCQMPLLARHKVDESGVDGIAESVMQKLHHD
jgi:hypothetical protein